MKKIDVYYSKISKGLSLDYYQQYLQSLPQDLREKNVKYRRWEDRHANLFGKILLKIGYEKLGHESDILNKIRYEENLRPYIDGKIDFNITHSGKYVLCAIGLNVRLGIDVEEIKEIDFDDFKEVMTIEEWHLIKNNENPLKMFYELWMIKESVIKADGRGMSIPLRKIQIFYEEKVAWIENSIWYFSRLHLDKDNAAYIATDVDSANYRLNYVDFYSKNLFF